MSPLGQKRTFRNVRPMSAILPKADIRKRHRYVKSRTVRFTLDGDGSRARAFFKRTPVKGRQTFRTLLGLRTANVNLSR